MTLNQGQQSAFKKLTETTDNIFLTGGAGTGKSFLIRTYLDKFSERMRPPVLASTGAAAVLIKGRTLHAFFGIGIMQGGLQATIDRCLKNQNLRERMQDTDEIIIDEISMISGPVLEACELIARTTRGMHRLDQRNIPWGGMRVIVVGDFTQLPPVNPNAKEREWAFKHRVWQESNFKTAALTEVMRSSEESFMHILNKVRLGNIDDDVMTFLDSRIKKPENPDDIPYLFSRKVNVEQHNLTQLHKLPGPVSEFPTTYRVAEWVNSQEPKVKEGILKQADNFPIPRVLQIKPGALVMFRTNEPSGIWGNGSLGHVDRIETEEYEVTRFIKKISDEGEEITVPSIEDRHGPVIYVKLERNGLIYKVIPQDFETLDKDGEVIMRATNYPLSLAWAVTIHKSQGMSLDRFVTDLSALWEPGQGYVALSRAKNPDGIFLEGYKRRSIFADRDVLNFYKGIQ